MTSYPLKSLSEYQRLPKSATDTQYYKQYLEAICNNATLALFVMDEQQHCVYMNPAAEQLTGYKLTEVEGRALHDVIHHTRADGTPYPLCECPIDQVFPQNNQEQGEEVFVHRDGHFYPVAYTASPIREGGKTIGTVIEVRDVTQEKLAAKAQQEATERERDLRQAAESARERAETVLQSIAEAFVVFDRDWKYVYVSPSATRLLQKSEAELIGRRVWDVFPDLVATPVYEAYHRSVAEQVPLEFEFIYPTWNRWFINRAYPSEKGLSVFVADITERKQTEAALKETEEQLRLAIECAKLGTWDFNLLTGQLNWDNGSKAMFGLASDAEVSYELFESLVHPADLVSANQAVETAIAPGSSGDLKVEYRVIRASDGLERWISSTGQALFDPTGKAIRLIGAVIDITETKQREAERQQLLEREQRLREQAEQANRIKDEFLAVLSHELRTPLNPILGWTRMLKAGKCPSAKVPQALETIERNAHLQAQLIEDLLDVSRILQGKLTLNTDSVRLVDIIEAALETVRLAADSKAIDIHLNLDANVGTVRGDANRLQQVIWNLLSNAVKFTPNAGRVEVTLSQVGMEAQIQVRDTGKGIRAEVLPYIFDRFRQADSSTTRQFGGLGLGLAIARHLVELHGGTISAESAGENQGATFTVTLPIALSQMQDDALELPRSSRDLAGIKILAVDDEPDNLDFLVFLLEAMGAIVESAQSAKSAFEKLPQFQPDLLISDIAMPDFDGYQLIQRIREQTDIPAGASRLPAIALTAYAGEINQRQILAAGFQRHLAKPVDPDELVNTIVSLLN